VSITPRKAEVEAVIALLESDDFDTSRAMAVQIVKQIADDLSRRDTKGVALSFPGQPPGLALGPYYSTRDAQKALTGAREAGMDARICRLSGTGAIRPIAVLTSECGTCGHRVEMHPKVECYVHKCECKELT